MTIPVVDIFAGPGGLGEGFSALRQPGTDKAAFKISISAEMEENAARTLRLRAFYRQFPTDEVPASYYDYVEGRSPTPWTSKTEEQWRAACSEAQQLTLGESSDDRRLYERIASVAAKDAPWVLVGGPPCQAYSLVGRARNSGIRGYKAENDSRHFLYQHYLKIIARYQPTAFIMENVKGILSSKVAGKYIFPRILDDLHHPGKSGRRYRILPLVDGDVEGTIDGFEKDSYIVRSELLGVPQARHRVILFGIAEDMPFPSKFIRTDRFRKSSVREAINSMPPLRSGVTDSVKDWSSVAKHVFATAAVAARPANPLVASLLRELARSSSNAVDPGCGGLRIARARGGRNSVKPSHLHRWLIDSRLKFHLNHEARGHMQSDLMRYAFAAAFAEVHERSPRGHLEFPDALAPDHENWASGKFLDRFKVQSWNGPSSTVTSHLAKDGHYFIHPDPRQIRSLSVREAARLQTFPDNYFFEGPRGAQFRQVGNAVPPLMAHQIAEVVHAAISR